MIDRMWRVIRLLLLAAAAAGVVFVVGMRQKSPVVVDAVRRSGRAMKPMALRFSGTPGAPASIVRHRGRRSRQSYETPVQVVETEDGFAIGLPYGRRPDWLKNVLASGEATIVHEGATAEVDRPTIVPMAEAERYFPASTRRSHRLFRVEECLVVRRAGSGGGTDEDEVADGGHRVDDVAGGGGG